MANESAQGILYLLGGDTYDGDTTARSQLPGVLDMKWETGYKNDGEQISLSASDLFIVPLCFLLNPFIFDCDKFCSLEDDGHRMVSEGRSTVTWPLPPEDSKGGVQSEVGQRATGTHRNTLYTHVCTQAHATLFFTVRLSPAIVNPLAQQFFLFAQIAV